MNATTITEHCNNFIHDDGVDKEALREFVWESFTRDHAWAEFLLTSPTHKQTWDNLHDYVMSLDSKKKEIFESGLDTILQLHEVIHEWMKTKIDSGERMEFWITSRAAAIASGDELGDYFAALAMCHDDLLAAVLVFQEALEKLAILMEMDDAREILENEAFEYFIKTEWDERIAGVAKEIGKRRSA